MRGTVILSHGLHSSPDATKVGAMAQVAGAAGWAHQRPDFRDLDSSGRLADIDRRIQRLCEHIDAVAGRGPVVLAGSSMGAFASALATLHCRVDGLFLLVPPAVIDGYPQALDAARVPTWIIHAWDDELIPAMDVVRWARRRRNHLVMVPDGHRLEAHVGLCAETFGRFLDTL
jgi:predicted alpha/beta-hydrolase family hydrolase